MNEHHVLEVCAQYGMDEIECKAVHVAYAWVDLLPRIFPDQQHPLHPLTKSKDPRKSLLFKFCYKLVRETRTLIADEDYELYVRAQLEVLKVITIGKNEKPLISPQILVGEKAWRRWMLWKRKYDQRHAEMKKPSLLKVGGNDLLAALSSTRAWFVVQLGEYYTLTQFIQDRDNIAQAAAIGRISAYYLALSPFVRELSPDGSKFQMDYEATLESLPENAQGVFETLFPNEKTQHSP